MNKTDRYGNIFVRLVIFFILIFPLFFTFSCKKKQSPEEISEPSRIEVNTSEIVITYLEGDVYKNTADEWEEVFEEDLLSESDIVKTETDSYCELQFGDIALIRVQANSLLKMNSINTEFGKADVELGLTLGTVLCKVEKLVEDERFQVVTPGSVCGVRGTQFGIEVNEASDVSLFVEEGACAVIPLSVSPDTISETLTDNPELAEILIQEVEKSALVVTADQEVKVSKASLVETEARFKQVSTLLNELSKKKSEEIEENEKENLKKLIKASTEEAITKSTEVSNVSKTHKEELKNIEKIKKKEIKVKTRELKLEEEKPETEKVEVEPVRENSGKEDVKEEIKQKIIIHSKPNKAKVYLNGKLTGSTPATIKDLVPGNYKIRLEKEGYINLEEEIDLIPGKDVVLDYELEKEGPPRSKISIHTNPEKVSAYWNGEYLGRTPCDKENVEYGEYEIVLQLRGYSSITHPVIVDEEKERFVYTLKAETCEVATIGDLVDFLGPPDNYSAKELDELREIKSHAEPIDFIYKGRFYFEIIDLHLASILLTGDKQDFTFSKKIGINSPRSLIEEVFGEPGAILAEGKLLRYSKKGLSIEIDTEDLASSFRLYKLDPLLILDPVEDTDPGIAEFFKKLQDFPSHYGIE